eukprot:UN28331
MSSLHPQHYLLPSWYSLPITKPLILKLDKPLKTHMTEQQDKCTTGLIPALRQCLSKKNVDFFCVIQIHYYFNVVIKITAGVVVSEIYKH